MLTMILVMCYAAFAVPKGHSRTPPEAGCCCTCPTQACGGRIVPMHHRVVTSSACALNSGAIICAMVLAAWPSLICGNMLAPTCACMHMCVQAPNV